MKINISSEKTSKEYLCVNSCGIEKLNEIDRGSIRPYGRIDYHILYIEQGACYISDSMQKIEAGNIIMYRPGEEQIYHFYARDNSISHYIHFTGVGCKALLEKLGIDKIAVFNMGTSRTYEDISLNMVREFAMKRPSYEHFCAAYLYELLALISRKYLLRENKIGKVGEGIIKSACRKMYDNIDKELDLNSLARESMLSKSRFSHLFKECMGKSPSAFLLSMRIERARELLETSELSVREVGEAVGYFDQNYFSRIFKKNVGMSPTVFRLRLFEKNMKKA